MPRQFTISPKRSLDGSLAITVTFDPSVGDLSPREQGDVYDRAMFLASEAAKTAADPVIARRREELTRRMQVARAG